MAQVLDPKSLELVGEPFPVVSEVRVNANNHKSGFTVSANGALAYRHASALATTQLVWVDREGREIGVVGPEAAYDCPALSPDGKRVAVMKSDSSQPADILILDVARGASAKLTQDPSNRYEPVWSQDGSRLAFSSDRQGGILNFFQTSSTGTGKEEALLQSERSKTRLSWSPDGRYIVYAESNGKDWDLWTMPLTGDRKPAPYLQTPFNESNGQVSPDGRWLAYTSDESGQLEIYVQSFPAAGNKAAASSGGGNYPSWRRDGKELFFVSSRGEMMAADVLAGGSETGFKAGEPHALFHKQLRVAASRAQYDVSADGHRFLLNVPARDTVRRTITVVLNWLAAPGK